MTVQTVEQRPLWPILARGYIATGCLLGVVACLSYIVQAWRSTDGSLDFIDSAVLVLSASWVGVAAAILRAAFWMPSLVVWIVAGSEPFSAWIMPGLATALR